MSGVIPTIAIVTVTLNDLPGLLATRAGLRRQTRRDFRWIVVDGGSSDGTADWLRAHADEAAWWRSASDRGIYDAMNIGLDVAVGMADVVLFLNAGDVPAHDRVLEMVAGHFAAGDVDFVYGDAVQRVAGRGGGRARAVKRARSHRLAWLGMFTHHQAMAYRVTAVADLRFDPRFRIAADYDFTLTLLGRGARVDRIATNVAIFRAGGVSERAASLGRAEQARIRRDHYQIATLWNRLVVFLQWFATTTRTLFPGAYEAVRYSVDTNSMEMCPFRNGVGKELLFLPRSGIEFSSSANYVADRRPVYLPSRARK